MDDFSPVRHGRHVTIRPVLPSDYERLHQIAMFTDAGSRWRLGDYVPPPEGFFEVLFEKARATFTIEVNASGTVIGMVQLWNYDPANRNGHITAFLDPDVRGRGWPLEAVLLFIEYAFAVYDLNKLYFEAMEPELEQYGSIVGSFLKREGVMRQHRWVHGRFVDCHILALFAEDVPRLLGLLSPRQSAEGPPNQTGIPDGVVIIET